MFNVNESGNTIAQLVVDTTAHPLLKDVSLSVQVTPCLDPFCACGDVTLTFMTDEQLERMSSIERMEHLMNEILMKGDLSAVSQVFEAGAMINVHDQEILDEETDFELLETSLTNIEELLETCLTKKDWELLGVVNYMEKIHQADAPDLDNVNIDDFRDVFLAHQGDMIAYKDVFPASARSIQLDGIFYFITEAYCTKLDCGCSEIVVEFYSPTNVENELKRTGAISYDYMSGVLGGQEGSTSHDVKLFQELNQMYPDIDEIFEQRHANIRTLASRVYGRGNVRSLPNIRGIGSSVTKKVGRNVLCPCGSGKKYKRCCGK